MMCGELRRTADQSDLLQKTVEKIAGADGIGNTGVLKKTLISVAKCWCAESTEYYHLWERERIVGDDGI